MVVKGDEKNRVRDVSVFKMGRLAPSARGDRTLSSLSLRKAFG